MVVRSGLVVLIIAFLAAIYWQARINQTLRADLSVLHADVQRNRSEIKRAPSIVFAPSPREAAPRVRENDPEVEKLRQDVVNLQSQLQKVAANQTALHEPEPAAPVELVPANKWRNVGRDSPAAAMETFYWAALAGELDTMADALTFPDDVRAKLQSWFAGLSEPVRLEYGSPEKLLGLMIARDAGLLSGMALLEQNRVNDTDVMVRMRYGTEDGDVDDAEYLLRNTSAGWRLVIPAQALDHFTRHMRPDGPP